MGDLVIRNISPALKADLERLAVRKGTTFAETAKDALRKGLDQMTDDKLEEPPTGQTLTRILGGIFESEDEFREFQTILEDIRKGKSRPLPDFE